MTMDGKALVVSTRGDVGKPGAAARTPSAFAAQLLAVRLDAPEYRLRRKAAPDLAAAAYRRIAALSTAAQT